MSGARTKLPKSAIAIRAHRFKRVRNEHYVDPAWCSSRLFDVETFPGVIWDPACGWGTIQQSAAARKPPLRVISTDLVDRGWKVGQGGIDFLRRQKLVGEARSIVCNPPFNLMREFPEHALALGAEKIAMIALLRRLPAAHWLKQTPLARIYLLAPRPSMPTGSYIRRGGKVGGGTQDFCWLVWERGFGGKPQMLWLHRI
jgi:hypothetical protein